MPFDRLVRAVDDWARDRQRTDVFSQIHRGGYVPIHIDSTPFLDPPGFRSAVAAADLVVSHAGMGTILTALELSRPIVVLPRLGSLRETRNDHQSATARQLETLGLVTVAWDATFLPTLLDNHPTRPTSPAIRAHASGGIVEIIRQFLTTIRE